jgi:hypothetical protein
MAWLDINADQKTDVFVGRGGMRGMMKEYAPEIKDELFLANPTGFKNEINEFGLVKKGCPGRQTAWTDIDGDQKADLYIVCGQGKAGEDFPNLLYHQTNVGQFSEQAKSYGLDFPGSGSFIWFDVDQDQDLDFFWADHQAYWLYLNQNGQFKPQRLASAPADVKKLALADYDNDGDLDLFAISASQSSLFVNSGRSLAAVAPSTLGLPVQVKEASWVDIDRDGLMDLHTLPDGFYQQEKSHRFTATRQLTQKATDYPRAVWTAWFDIDNDGSRDLLLAIEDQPSLMQRALQRGLSLWRQKILRRAPENPLLPTSTLILYHHKPAKQHWLELDLFNKAQASAIGASVTVATAQGQQTQQVGQSEGSLFSQGHYRLYFELGKQLKPEWLRVTWPDGSSQELRDIAADRVIEVTQET